MWFWFSLIALLCWSGSDLFSKIGCADSSEKGASLKMVVAVGFVMGLHALYEVTAKGVVINGSILLKYLPVSLLYISSMAIGYAGLKYIELSISSPICNSSGALVAVAALLTAGMREINGWQLGATGLVCAGVIGLGIVEYRENEDTRLARQQAGNYRYVKSWLAIALPVIYCLLDAAGTFADSFVLEHLDEDSANVAYELTFLAAGILCAVYCFGIRRQRISLKSGWPRLAGAAFETAGQLAYIYAVADGSHISLSAPMISAYCAVSVLWGRLFLKEKLTKRHYLCIVLTVTGVILLGLFDI